MARTLNALVYPHTSNVVAERRLIDVATIPENKKSWWRPVETVGDDSFNPLTHKKNGPITTIEAARVLDTYEVVELTAQEISDAKDVAVTSLNGGYGPLIKALLSLHNRVRVLEGLPTHTMAQFKTGLKALL